MKKLLSLCLAILMILSAVSALASCGETTPDQTTDKTTESATARTDEGQTTETEEQKPAETVTKPAIPETDRDALLKVLHWTVDETWIPWEEICLFDFTGDVIDDAIYSRTSELHEKFGISLENEYMYVSDITHKVKNMTSSGTDEYQLIVQRSYQMQYSMMDDVFDNLSSLPHVDLSQPYWSQVSVDTFTFGGVTLFAASDMLLMDKSSTAAVAFNTSLANDHGWGGTYFYDLVRNNEWTFQKLVETASQAYVDLDGDTVVGPGDIFGAQGGDSPIHFLFNGSGEMFCRNTKDDRFLEYTFDKERCYNVIMDVLDLMVYDGWYILDKSTVPNAFVNNKVLFDIARIESINKYRIMEQDYGILPIPMYDDTQNGRYYSEISPHHDSVLAVPHTARDNDSQAEALGAALEELAYISHLTVYPVLYDVVISGKGTRDQESKEMLKIIFDSRIYDMGIIYDFAYFADKTLRMGKTGSSDIVSAYTEVQGEIDKQLGEVVTKLHELLD